MPETRNSNYWVELGVHPALFLTDPEKLTCLVEEATITKDANLMLACLNNVNLPQNVLLKTLDYLFTHRFPDRDESMDSLINSVASGFEAIMEDQPNNLNFEHKLASLSNLNVEVLNYLARNGDYMTLWGLSRRPTLSEETVLLMLNRQNKEISRHLALTCQLTDRIIAALRLNPDLPQHYDNDSLPQNPSFPENRLNQYFNVIPSVACNPQVTAEQLKTLYEQDLNNSYILSNPNLPLSIAAHKLNCSYKKVTLQNLKEEELENLVRNVNVPAELIYEKMIPRIKDSTSGLLKYNWFNMPTERIIHQILRNTKFRSIWFDSEPEFVEFRKKDWGRMLVKFLTSHYGQVTPNMPVDWLEELAKTVLATRD